MSRSGARKQKQAREERDAARRLLARLYAPEPWLDVPAPAMPAPEPPVEREAQPVIRGPGVLLRAALLVALAVGGLVAFGLLERC